MGLWDGPHTATTAGGANVALDVLQMPQAITGHQSLKPSPAISYLKSIYPLSHHYYGADHPRDTHTPKQEREMIKSNFQKNQQRKRDGEGGCLPRKVGLIT
ncbi:hypothetical protein CsSME_00028780 [Camellia sinensis var. sinensis]